MGTRGKIGFVIDGVTRTAYNHYDSYPSDLGEKMLAQAKELTPEYVREAVKTLVMVGETDNPTPEQAAKVADWTDSGVSTGTDWYSALREAQGDLKVYLSVGFMPDGSKTGGAEYAYFINFDTGVFTAYTVDWSSDAMTPFGSWPLTDLPENLSAYAGI